MPLLDSTDFSGGTVTHNAALKVYVITGGVRTVDETLTAPTGGWGGYTIFCRASGGLRFMGTDEAVLGGDSVSMFVVEEDDAHRFGNDNYQTNNARFAGKAKISNVVWIVESGTRSDFDIYRGTNSNGSQGPEVEFNGLYLIQRGSTRTYNHYASQNHKITVNEHTGFGFRLRNETQGHQMEFTNPPKAGVEIAGLVVDTGFTPANSADGAQIAFGGANGTVFNISGLKAASVSSTGNNITANLINPVGRPTVTNDWSGYNGTFNIFRDVSFDFSGVDIPASTALHAIATASGGVNATGSASGRTGTVRVRTDQSPHNSSDGAYTETRTFNWQMVGLPFRKYGTTTATTVSNTPATISVTLTPDELPDGTAITSLTSGDVSTAAELYRALKTWGIANRNEPDANSPLVTMDADGDLTLDVDAQLRLITSQTDLVSETSDGIYSVRCATGGVGSSNDIGLIDAGTTNEVPSSTKNLIKMPLRDSTGTSSQIKITAHANEVVGIFKNDGSKLGAYSFASDGTYTLLISAANSLANTRIGLARAGYIAVGKTIDISSGGSYSEDFPTLTEVPGGKYKSTANASNLVAGSVHTSASTPFEPGDITLRVKTGQSTAFDVYKAWSDTVAITTGHKLGEGCRAPAFGRQPLDITALEGQPGNIFLGPDCILQRGFPASSNTAAFIQAFVAGGVGGNAVNDSVDNPIFFNIQSGEEFDLAEVNTKLDSIIRQNAHMATSLPLDFPEGSPLSPLCAVQGLEGQEVIRDVESKAYAVTPSANVGIATNASGIHSFTGSNSHIDYTLMRPVNGVDTSFTEEIILLMQIRPTAFNASDLLPLFSIGALVVSIAPSSGDTAAVRVGAAGVNDTTELLRLNEWNTLVFSVQKQDGNANYPILRISVNGAAQQKWNDGSNENFAPLGANTTNFRLGARTSGNTSVGFIGNARAIFVHPNNEIYDDGNGWEIPTGIDWDTYIQIYTGASLMDRVEGVLSDVYEPIVDQIAAKSHDLADIAAAVLSQPFSSGISAGNSSTASITAFVKYLAGRSHTASDAADAVLGEALAGHSLDGSLGATVTSISNTVGGLPSAVSITNAVVAGLNNISSADVKAAVLAAEVATGYSQQRVLIEVLSALVGKTDLEQNGGQLLVKNVADDTDLRRVTFDSETGVRTATTKIEPAT